MNSLEITKCNNDGCTSAKANGEFTVVVLGLATLGLGVYFIDKYFEHQRYIESSRRLGYYPLLSEA